MTNNKISGSYILQSVAPIATYELTGNNRNAQVNITPGVINLIDLSNGSQNDRYIDLLSKNKIHLKAIRVITPGGAGLRCLNSAAILKFNLYSISESQSKGLFGIIEVSEFNEWQKLDDYWEPYKLTKEEMFNISITAGKLNIDDFNIQDKYIGETVNFKIELAIDTAGIVLDDNIV